MEGVCSYASMDALRPPCHSGKGDAMFPFPRTREAGSSSYFFLVTFGFFKDAAASAPRALCGCDEAKCLEKYRESDLLGQHAREVHGDGRGKSATMRQESEAEVVSSRR